MIGERVVEARLRLKDNSRYDRFQVVLARPCHCGGNHVVGADRNGWDLLLRVKACLSIVRDVNVLVNVPPASGK